MKRTTKLFGCIFAFGVMSALSQAALLDQLFNTGVDNSKVKLATGVPTVDPHYSLVSNPAGYLAAYAVNGFETGQPWNWLPSSLDYTDVNGTYASQWISPVWNRGGDAGNIGNVTPMQFNNTMTIDLGTLPSADIKGAWMADNGSDVTRGLVSDILVNGTATGNQIFATNNNNGWDPFQQWTTFDLNGSYFHTGINTITFSVVNWPQGQGNPTGVRAVFTSAEPVPEPFAMGLTALGVGLAGVIRRRRRS